jgi:hypothetical protein
MFIKTGGISLDDPRGHVAPQQGALDRHAVEEVLRKQMETENEMSLVLVPGEEWAGSISSSKVGHDTESSSSDGTKNKNNNKDAREVTEVARVTKEDSDEVDSTLDDDGDGDDYVRDHQVDAATIVDVEDYGDAIEPQGDEEEYTYEFDEKFVIPEAKKDAKKDVSSPSPEVQEGLTELRACTSLECIKNVHKKLVGKTKFNAPHYFLIGFQKCATTSVNNYLRGHPEYMPSVLKESHYFTACAKSWNDSNCKANSTQDYIDNYLRISDAVDKGLTAATVDASVDYAWKGEDLAREIHKAFPWLKIVVMMREPISRVISYTRMWTQKGVRTSTHKDNRIACDADEDLFDCLYPHLTPTAYTGHYAVPLEGWLKVWPADQIHVIQFEEFIAETETVMRRLKTFLGLDPALPENQQVYNVNTRKDSGASPMKRREYRTLIEMARPDSERVADLLHRHGLADRKTWMKRWEQVWKDNLESCNEDRICMVNSN